MSSVIDNAARIREILDRESAPWGRAPVIVAATKYVTGEEMLPLLQAGIRSVGENRVQQLREKLPVISGKFDIHFIGRLQSNKVNI